MNFKTKRIGAVPLAAASIVALGACSTVNTAPDAVALHYSGGAFESQKFVECVPASTRQVNGPGEHYYYYPIGQRTYSFTGKDSGGEADPISTNTKDAQQVAVPGFVTFELDGTTKKLDNGKLDCPAIREFHEKVGYKSKAYFEGNPDTVEIGAEGQEKGRQQQDSKEWVDFLKQYVATPLDTVMDDNGQKFGWKELYQNQSVQDQFRQGVKADLPKAVNAALGTSTFVVKDIVISTPRPSDSMLNALKDTEVAKEQNSAQAEKNKVAATKYQSMQECKNAGISEQSCVILKLADDGKIPFYTVPQGTSIQVAK